MGSHFYPIPFPPQGTVPPQRKLVPPGQVGNNDVVLIPNRSYIIRAAFSLEEERIRRAFFYGKRRESIVGKLPDQVGAADNPATRDRLYLPLEQYRWVIEPQFRLENVKLPPSEHPAPPHPALLFARSRIIQARIIQQHHDVDRFTPIFTVTRSARQRSEIRLELPFIPPGRLVAFQPNAFQSTYPGELYAFQSKDRFVTLSIAGQSTLGVRELISIVLGPFMQEYRKGTAIVITAQTYDPAQVPAVLFNPSGGVHVSLIDPSGVFVLDGTALGRISTGNYRTIYQTTDLSTLGVYLIEATSSNVGNSAITIRQQAFRLVEGT